MRRGLEGDCWTGGDDYVILMIMLKMMMTKMIMFEMMKMMMTKMIMFEMMRLLETVGIWQLPVFTLGAKKDARQPLYEKVAKPFL